MTLVEQMKKFQNIVQNSGEDAAALYLISFRISNKDLKSYHNTYSNLMSEIKILDPDPYHHTTSTYVIRSNVDINICSAKLTTPLGADDHLIVVELPKNLSTRFKGPNADFSELQSYIPSITKI